MSATFRHIVTVGTSTVDNFTGKHGAAPTRPADLTAFIDQSPRQHSAELNALCPFIDRQQCHSVHLVASNTPTGQLARQAIGQWLKLRGIHHTSATFDPPSDHDPCPDPYAGLLKLILNAAKSADDCSVLINATGGFKGQSITAALAARLLNLPAYYLFETMTTPVFLPTVHPTGSQLEQLRRLRDRHSFTDHRGLTHAELVALEQAGLVFLQRRADGNISSVKLTAYAELSLEA